MSDYIKNRSERLERLKSYALRMLEGERGSELYAEYVGDFPHVTPQIVITVIDELVKTGEEIDQVKRTVNKILNVFYEPLQKFGEAKPEQGSFIYFLMAENKAMKEKLADLKLNVKAVLNQKNPTKNLLENKESLLSKLTELRDFEKHYQKKENILFPYFEKIFPDHRCANVMWSMHDDARKSLNNLIENLERDNPSANEFNFNIGRLFFSVLPVIFRDDYILYALCQQSFSEQMQVEMMEQSLDIGFCFIDAPKMDQTPGTQMEGSKSPDDKKELLTEGLIDLGTGKISIDQIINLFNHLPIDITYVDENEKVVYFSHPKDRFFTRSKAIIGRKVQNCHPPESIDVVNRIIESFRSGKKDKESFWIQIKGKFILIQYFAVRDESAKYMGTIEVSQDITDIRNLEGERRLLS